MGLCAHSDMKEKIGVVKNPNAFKNDHAMHRGQVKFFSYLQSIKVCGDWGCPRGSLEGERHTELWEMGLMQICITVFIV